jgi:hypothetical protein
MRDKITKGSAQRDAGQTFQRRPMVTEYEKTQEAIRKNYERLKAERLAREARSPDDKVRDSNNRGLNPPPAPPDNRL